MGLMTGRDHTDETPSVFVHYQLCRLCTHEFQSVYICMCGKNAKNVKRRKNKRDWASWQQKRQTKKKISCGHPGDEPCDEHRQCG